MKHSKTGSLAVLLGLLWLAPAPLRAASAAATARGTITGKVTAPGLPSAGNVLVYVASVPGQFPPPAAVQMDQRSLAFEPHVLPVVVGTTVNFMNDDDVQHSVFTPSPAGDLFNLGTWPKGQSRSYTFTKMGKVELLCNVHHEMKGYILVLQNSFFALTDSAGRYHIENLPPGNYQLKVWHERAGAAPAPVQVSAGTVTVNFDLVSR